MPAAESSSADAAGVFSRRSHKARAPRRAPQATESFVLPRSEAESAEHDRRHAPHARIAFDDLAEIVRSRIGDGRFRLQQPRFSVGPSRTRARRPQPGLLLYPWRRAWPWPCRARRASTHRASWLGRPYCPCGLDRRAGRRAEHLVEHGERGVGESRLHLAREHDQSRQATQTCRNARDVARSRSRISLGNRRVARTMNALLAVGSDAELAHGFEPFDDLDKIPLTRRFRPFS